MTAVLVPYDGSKLSRDALEFACERFPEAEITALFVVDTSVTHQPEQYVGAKLGDIYEQREAEAEEVSPKPRNSPTSSTFSSRRS